MQLIKLNLLPNVALNVPLKYFGEEAKRYEMEGYSIVGGAIDCIIIKGVCDFDSGKKQEIATNCHFLTSPFVKGTFYYTCDKICIILEYRCLHCDFSSESSLQLLHCS